VTGLASCSVKIHGSPYAQFTPHELYLKFLYEYFRGELNLPEEIEDIYLPTGFKKLKYQEEAVLNARKALDEYGGAFLSDVVGLGKTYMSALLAQQINEPCLVIAPPHLLDEHNPGSWPNVFREFGVRGHLCESLGKLESLLDRDLSKFTTVFIDESHRFRTEDTQSYEMLAQICRGKRVVLVSATPLNNTPQDILSQIKLFQPGKTTRFDKIFTYNFFPTEEGNDLIKLREAAEAKIHAFIQMLGADARLLTEGEEIVSHDLFAKWNSRKTITGEDEDEDTELKFLTEIRTVRDKQPELFERIKRLPKKARSTRCPSPAGAGEGGPAKAGPGEGRGDKNQPCGEALVQNFPSLLTYFRQGKLDKFFLAAQGRQPTNELDFMSAAKILKPADAKELRQPVPREFYDLLDRNKAAFVTATTADAELAEETHRGDRNAAYILKRLKAKEIRRCPQYTEDDEEFVGKIIRLVDEGSLPKRTAKDVAARLKKEIEPLKVLAILRRGIKRELFQASPVAQAGQALAPREVILSSYLVDVRPESGGVP